MVSYVQANGLSQASVKACQGLIGKSEATAGVQADLVSYLVGELAKVGGQGCWHGCTNVLESLFGHYKSSLPTNPLAGVSGVVLSLSLRTGEAFGPDLCRALEGVSLADLQAWKAANLAKSQVVRRRKVLEK